MVSSQAVQNWASQSCLFNSLGFSGGTDHQPSSRLIPTHLTTRKQLTATGSASQLPQSDFNISIMHQTLTTPALQILQTFQTTNATPDRLSPNQHRSSPTLHPRRYQPRRRQPKTPALITSVHKSKSKDGERPLNLHFKKLNALYDQQYRSVTVAATFGGGKKKKKKRE